MRPFGAPPDAAFEVPPRRIHVIGPPGSGKTTAAARLVAAIGIPAHDLDEVAYTRAGERPHEERDAQVRAILAAEGWVTEGAYLGWTEPLIEAADAVLWIDRGWWECAWRMVTRHAKAERGGHNPHPGWQQLGRFIWYTRGYHAPKEISAGRATRQATALALGPHEAKVWRCSTNLEVERFLAAVQPPGVAP